MSSKIYNHLIQTNEVVKTTIKTFRKPKHANNNKRNKNSVQSQKRS
jgi:hypothetical protein